jgi:hypothetical protein
MTIGFNKLTELLAVEVNSMDALSDDQKRHLIDLCKRIYMREVQATEGVSSQRIGEAVRQDIATVADKILEEGV